MTTVELDRERVLKHCTIKGAQMLAVLTPPILIARAVYKRSFSLRRFMGITAFNTVIVGPPLGYLAGYGRLRNASDEAIQDRAYRLRNNISQVRTDDFALVGAVVGALLTTTIFLRRIPVWITIPAGGAFGADGGLITHLVTSKQSSSPNAMIEEIKSSYPLKEVAEEVAAGNGDKVIKGK